MDKNTTPITSEDKLFESIKCGAKLAKHTYSGCDLIRLNEVESLPVPEENKEKKLPWIETITAKFRKNRVARGNTAAKEKKSMTARTKKLVACIVVGTLLVCAEAAEIIKINAATMKENKKHSNSYAFVVKTVPEQISAGHGGAKDAAIATAKKKEEEDAKKKAEEEARAKAAKTIIHANWNGSPLTRSRGAHEGPSGKETYYNLNMSGVVGNMRRMGYDEGSYPYWVRGDGAKMLGPYIMVAANLNLRPKGTLVTTSMGVGIVADTGGFAAGNPTQIDIATNW